MPAKHLSVLVTVGLLLALGGAETARATPVSFLSHVPGKPFTSFSVKLTKSPASQSCLAASTASLYRYPGPVRIRVLRRTFNVCTTTAGTTRYTVKRGQWATRILSSGQYRTCVSATQRLRSGAFDTDVACRTFSL